MPADSKHTVFLVDDHPTMLVGLRTIINQEADMTVCGELASGKGAAEIILKANPAVLILDWALRDATGLEILKDLRASEFLSPILIVSMYKETHYAPRALRNGASGYVMKGEATDHLIHAIRQVLNGDIFLSSQMHGEVARSVAKSSAGKPVRIGLQDLTDREFEVYELMGQGFSTAVIAKRLKMAEKTVATHRGKIKSKLGIANITALVQHATAWIEAQAGDGG